jgi:hypothetical protein
LLLLTPSTGAACLCSDSVTKVQFADDDTVLSSDSRGHTKVWDIATGEEKTKALGRLWVDFGSKG